MKKTIIVTVLMLSAASLTFGQNFYGRQDRTDNAPAFCYNGDGFSGVVEIVELEGKISINANTFPSIKSGKEELDLLIGPAAVDALKLKSGDSVAVKGIKIPGPNWSVDGDTALKVREITVNGKTYLVAGRMGGMDGRGPGMDGSRRGDMDNRSGRYFPQNNYGPKGR